MRALRAVVPVLIAVAVAAGCAHALAADHGATTAPGATDGATAAAKKKAKKPAKRKRCRKGYVLKTVKVKRKGRTVRVKRCRKRKAPQPARPGPHGQQPEPQPLFQPPGRRLEGETARPFLERYLVSSTFTDCVAGWPNCPVEERYGHLPNGAFHYCRLTPTVGADIRFGSTYRVQNAVVEANGGWSFNELVDNDQVSIYEWSVAVDGTVTGAYSYGGGAPQAIGPLRYVAGGRDCSY